MNTTYQDLQRKADFAARALDSLLDAISELSTAQQAAPAPAVYVHPYHVDENRFANKCDGCKQTVAKGGDAWIHNTKALDGLYHCWHYDRNCILASKTPHAQWMLEQMPSDGDELFPAYQPVPNGVSEHIAKRFGEVK